MLARFARYQNHLILHIIILFWAYTGLIGHSLPWPSEMIVWYRMAIAVGVLLVILVVGNHFRKISLPSTTEIKLATLAGIALALHWWSFFAAIKLSSVSVGLICLSATPLLTVLINSVISLKQPAKHELILGIVTISGLFIIVDVDFPFTAGILTGLVSAFLGAAFNIINKKLSNARSPVLISCYQISCGLILISILLVARGLNPIHFFPSGLREAASVLFLGVICTALAIVACLIVMRELSAYTVSLTVNLEPVYGILLAVLVRGKEEIMPPGFYLGAIIILSAIVVNTWITQKHSRPVSVI